jgi:serine/threonine-protein kinase
VIANTILLSEPQVDPGYQYIVKLLDLAQKSAAQPGTPAPGTEAAGAAPVAAPASSDGFAPMVALLKDAETALNTDRRLAESYAKAGNVVQPMLFALGEPLGRPDKPLPPFALKNAIATPKGAGESFGFLTSAVRLPIDSVGTAAAGLGHLNTVSDVDGGVRQEPLVLQYYDQLFPSMSMMIAARSLNLTAADIKVQRWRERLARALAHRHRPRSADVHLFLQGSRRPSGVQRGLVLRRSRAARSRSPTMPTGSC